MSIDYGQDNNSVPAQPGGDAASLPTAVSAARWPEYASAQDEPTNRVRCPLYGFIRYSSNERRLIDHSVFRRLRFIRQLALTEYIYPAANHTRFEHSLGVMEVATQAFDRLAAKRGALMEEVFRDAAAFRSRPLVQARRIVRLAALLHDIGHSAFSHAAEQVVHARFGGSHEKFSTHLLREHDFGRELDVVFGEGTAALVADVIEGGGAIAPQITLLHDIVSGVMDADRTDYLRRDAFHCGVDYGVFDHRRLIEALDLFRDGDGLTIAIHRDGIHSLEALISARYQMSVQVYYHRLRRLYDDYLVDYFSTFSKDTFATDEAILALTDIKALAAMHDDALNSTDAKRQMAADRIINRRHHRWVFTSGDHATILEQEHVKRVYERLVTSHAGVTFKLVKPRKAHKIHDLMKPDDTDADEKFTRLYLVRTDGSKVLVTEESAILRMMPRNFLPVMIFADLPSGAQLNKIRADAARFAKEA